MSEICDQNCAGCALNCEDRKEDQTDFTEKLHELSKVKKVIAVVSGKGGVGKSLITSMLAVAMNKKGYKTAILDADITGPSIPKAFGIKEKAIGYAGGIVPASSQSGIDIMSVNLLLENDTDPVVWRGPVIAGVVKQFWSDVIWQDIDYMFIDMPPGTGDVPLTVFQSLDIDGIIVVTSPQELVSMIVSKAVNMANMMHIPVIGLVENYSYFLCPDNGKQYQVFGESHIEQTAKKHSIPILAKLPIDPLIAKACDSGQIESLDTDLIKEAIKFLEDMEEVK